MGAAIYVTFEKPIPDLEPWKMSGKSLARHVSILDAIAKRANLTTLSAMVSVSASELDDLIGDDEQIKEDEKVNPGWVVRILRSWIGILKLVRRRHKEEWHDPDTGLTTVRALLAQVRDDPNRFDGESAMLMDDLNRVAEFLQAAHEQKIRFHFTYDF